MSFGSSAILGPLGRLETGVAGRRGPVAPRPRDWPREEAAKRVHGLGAGFCALCRLLDSREDGRSATHGAEPARSLSRKGSEFDSRRSHEVNFPRVFSEAALGEPPLCVWCKFFHHFRFCPGLGRTRIHENFTHAPDR